MTKGNLRAIASGVSMASPSASVAAIIRFSVAPTDTEARAVFFENLPRMFPHDQTASSWFSGPGKEQVAFLTAFRNGTLQGAYLMIAARAIGLDVGAMSGFDNAKVDAAFFPDGRFKSNFICAVGRGDPASLPPEGYRFSFDEACKVI